ncbi:MAG: MazG nucleotide pyrophosphohydrolase domain-containing protein [Methylovulum sp.]
MFVGRDELREILHRHIVAIQQSFNQLTPAETERLALLVEEMGETAQAIGKILRHGYESTHPDGGPTNRESLERELGDVRYATVSLCDSADVDRKTIFERSEEKKLTVLPFLHHQ